MRNSKKTDSNYNEYKVGASAFKLTATHLWKAVMDVANFHVTSGERNKQTVNRFTQ